MFTRGKVEAFTKNITGQNMSVYIKEQTADKKRNMCHRKKEATEQIQRNKHMKLKLENERLDLFLKAKYLIYQQK